MKFIKEELNGWNKLEITWLLVAISVIVSLSVYWQDTLIGIISATTGVSCVVFTGKGKRSCFIFGLINCLLYAIISYNARFYGEVMLNAIYYLPLQFYGFYVWSKNMNKETMEVVKKRMDNKSRWLLFLIVLFGVFGYGCLLKVLGGNLPYVDSFSTIASIVAMIVSIKMYMEQWYIWILVNVVTIIMWGIAFTQGSESVATLLMWCVYLVNAIIQLRKWRKESYGL